jgi:hypothetical protein
MVPLLNPSELKHKYNTKEFSSLSVIACNAMISTRFGSKTLQRSLKHFHKQTTTTTATASIITTTTDSQEDCNNDNDDASKKKKQMLKLDSAPAAAAPPWTLSSYWLPTFSVPLHSVLHPWAQTRNLIISSPSFQSLAVRSLELAVRECSLANIIKASLSSNNSSRPSKHGVSGDYEEDSVTIEALKTVVGSEGVLGDLESLHLCAPLLSVNGFIKLFQLLIYPLTPHEMNVYYRAAAAAAAAAANTNTTQSSRFHGTKQSPKKNSARQEDEKVDDVDSSHAIVEYKQPDIVVIHEKKTAIDSDFIPSKHSSLFKNAIRSCSLHTLTISVGSKKIDTERRNTCHLYNISYYAH